MLAIYAILQYIGQRGVTVYFGVRFVQNLKANILEVPTLLF